MDVLTFREARLADLDRIMALEQAGFAPGNREARAVYARRIEVFAAGSLLACIGPQVVGCLFSEIWRTTDVPEAAHFALGHDILDRHDPQAGTELYVTSMTVDPARRGQRLGGAGVRRRGGAAGGRVPASGVGVVAGQSELAARAAHLRGGGFRRDCLPAGFFQPGAGLPRGRHRDAAGTAPGLRRPGGGSGLGGFEVFQHQLDAGHAVVFVHGQPEGGVDGRRGRVGVVELDGFEPGIAFPQL